jgi:hypothetical protein
MPASRSASPTFLAWLSIMAVGLLLLGGCMYIPVNYHAAGSRSEVSSATQSKLEPGVTTKEDVFLLLGEPDYASEDGQYLGYRWTKVLAWIGTLAGGEEARKSYLLQVSFDVANRVSRVDVLEQWGTGGRGWGMKMGIPPILPIAEVRLPEGPSSTFTVLRRRYSSVFAPAVHYISLDGVRIAALKIGQYATFPVAAGRHLVGVTWVDEQRNESHSQDIEVETGPSEAYFLVTADRGFTWDFAERVTITRTNRLEGELDLTDKEHVPTGPREW